MLRYLLEFRAAVWLLVISASGVVAALAELGYVIVRGNVRSAWLEFRIVRNRVTAFLIRSLARWIRDVDSIIKFFIKFFRLRFK